MTEQRGIERLKAIMATLRGECGCPWDRKQTIPSLKPYVIEEAYEVVEAMDEGPDELQDELGDLLLQVVFIAQMAQEEGLFDFDSVAERISDKLVRRHPHVFGTTQVKDADEVVQNWNQIKKDKEAKKYLMDGIPTAMPATLLTQRYADRAASVGFDWGRWEDTLAKIAEETAELKEAVASG
ncbi:MAG TPA: nucleoside triphosphate pyrophosphohydrolase, partial [bacterium]|nr:nucleoside triphosphate pyrophosphohydrolase [bacterium]